MVVLLRVLKTNSPNPFTQISPELDEELVLYLSEFQEVPAV